MIISITEFKKLVRRYVLDDYRLNDRGHQIGHADDVCIQALKINTQYALGLDERAIVVACYLHDMFARHRRLHHVLGSMIVHEADTPWVEIFSVDTARDVECAVCEHRASYKGDFHSLLSELVSAADRGAPEDPERLVHRIMSCSIMSRCPNGIEPHAYAVEFLKIKSGTGGYARYPPLYHRIYGEQLETFRKEIDLL